MSKAFSPLTLGVGFTALLALVPGLGIGSKEARADKPTAPAKASADSRPVPKGEATEAFLDQCLAERPQARAVPLRATILTLPDPQRTHMAFWFDLRLNAVQRAFKQDGFLPRAFFLPWEASPKEDTGLGVSSRYPVGSPGLIWFARERRPTDPQGGPTAYHALFIVGESQALGLNREAMRQALRLAAKAQGAGTEPAAAAPISLIGPQFSGSLTSLGAALEEHFRLGTAPPIRVQGTTTLDAAATETLRATAGGVPAPRLSISSWICNLSGASKEQLLSWYRLEAGWPKDASKVAIFTESNTVYSPGGQASTGPGTGLGGPVTTIFFPMGLSRLRAERRAMEHNLAKGSQNMELVLPSTLLGPSEDDALRVLDTLPQYSADSLRDAELTLAGTVLSLARRGYTHIGISASDPQDLIFLAERVRAYHPSCTLFTTSGNHTLFAHPNFSAAMDGMILIGGYPLTDAVRVLSLKKGELESPVRFNSEGEYAAYYATLLALDPTRAKDLDRRFWGKQGFISIVKGGNIWPLRHGGIEVTTPSGAIQWDRQLEGAYLEVGRQSTDLAEYVHSRLLQLSVLLLLLGGTSFWIFLKPLIDLAATGPQDGDAEPSLAPYRDLATGALLVLAVLTLMGVAYLLPFLVLTLPPGGNTFLWLSLAAWALLLLLTTRALQAHWGWSRALPLVAAALAPAVAVGCWARWHFLVFVPGYLRFTSPGRGVSLLPTLLFLTAALALLLRTWFDVRRQEHAAFWPVPVGLASVPGRHLEAFRGLHARWWIFLFVLGLLALHRLLPGGLFRPLLEVQGIAAIVLGVGGCVFVVALLLFWQLQRGWRELMHVLEELDFSPYRAAFTDAGRLMNWNAMRALGRGLRTHRSSLRGRQLLEGQRAWMAEAEPAYARNLAALAQEEAGAPRGRKGASDYARWQFRFHIAGLMSACGDNLDSACGRLPAEAAAHQAEVHLFFALRAASFIRQAFLVARYLLVGSLGSMVLLLLAVAAFDFQPKGDVLAILGVVLIVMAGWVAYQIIQIERDPLLCLMEGTAPDQVQLSMGLVENGIRFVLVPLLLLLATFNPSLGGVVVQVFNPLMHLLK
ncbi:MAG: hypothetical protein H6P99_1108 [Holophagaceae bacterium]|nr:hypothetical protein [Holophagaceae bacterium]